MLPKPYWVGVLVSVGCICSILAGAPIEALQGTGSWVWFIADLATTGVPLAIFAISVASLPRAKKPLFRARARAAAIGSIAVIVPFAMMPHGWRTAKLLSAIITYAPHYATHCHPAEGFEVGEYRVSICAALDWSANEELAVVVRFNGSKAQLNELWHRIPQRRGPIDILPFRDNAYKVHAIFRNYYLVVFHLDYG